MNIYDRIINILLEAKIESYLERLDEMKKNKQGGFVASPDTEKGKREAAKKKARQAAKTPEQLASEKHAPTHPRKPGQKPWQAPTGRPMRPSTFIPGKDKHSFSKRVPGSISYERAQKRLATEPDEEHGSLTASQRNGPFSKKSRTGY